MRIVFMGTPDFAVPTLDAIVAAGHEVLAVVAQPDSVAGRGLKVNRPATVLRALELGLPVRQPRAINSGPFRDWFTTEAFDVAVVVAYGRILKPWHLAAPRYGCLNVHASLLPRWRGAAPIHHAILAGDARTGVCTMKMAEGLDTGDVLLCEETPIGPDETVGELWDRLALMGADLLVQTLDRLAELTPRPQDEALATLAPPLTRADGRVDWSRPAGRVHDHIRGLSPWPGAWTEHRGQPFKLWRSRPVEGEGPAGTVLRADDRLVVACGEGAVELLEAQAAGGRRQSGRELCNGRKVALGERLGAEGSGPATASGGE